MRCNLLRTALVLLPLAGLPLSAVAFENGPIDGRVIDVVTRQPISGVIVVAKWGRAEGFIADSVEVCSHVATAVSDAQGRYHIDKWQQKSSFAESLFASPYSVSLDAYKPGMEIVMRQVKNELMHEKTGVIELGKWPGTHAQRMSSLSALIHFGLRCFGTQGSNEILAAARDAVYAEARAIATTDEEDQKVLRSMDQMRYLDSSRSGEPQVVPPPAPPQH
jgi:hypothetical protein